MRNHRAGSIRASPRSLQHTVVQRRQHIQTDQSTWPDRACEELAEGPPSIAQRARRPRYAGSNLSPPKRAMNAASSGSAKQ